jgi:hypothetical protein
MNINETNQMENSMDYIKKICQCQVILINKLKGSRNILNK